MKRAYKFRCILSIMLGAAALLLTSCTVEPTPTTETSSYVVSAIPAASTVPYDEPLTTTAIPVDEVPATSAVETQPDSYLLTDENLVLLAKTIFLEAGIESYECKEAVASVIINRLNTGRWGETLHDVIYAPSQFAVAKNIEKTVPYSCPEAPYYEKSKEFISRWDDCFAAAEYVLVHGSTLPANVLYFRANYYFDWATPYTQIDHTYFSY